MVVDGGKGEIAESEKRKPMVLSVEALKACANGGASSPSIAEVGELFKCSHDGSAKAYLEQVRKQRKVE